jgi:hypothetical protein
MHGEPRVGKSNRSTFDAARRGQQCGARSRLASGCDRPLPLQSGCSAHSVIPPDQNILDDPGLGKRS